ncbi:hypothetical protein ACKFKG_26670 [Phormidesmis sp. 146-35]
MKPTIASEWGCLPIVNLKSARYRGLVFEYFEESIWGAIAGVKRLIQGCQHF